MTLLEIISAAEIIMNIFFYRLPNVVRSVHALHSYQSPAVHSGGVWCGARVYATFTDLQNIRHGLKIQKLKAWCAGRSPSFSEVDRRIWTLWSHCGGIWSKLPAYSLENSFFF